MAQVQPKDHLYLYLSEVTSRVVAESGIPSDRYHIGKIMLQSFKDDPDFVAQIDGGAGKSETYGSLLKRTVQCAISFREMGLKHRDVLVIMASNHLDVAVPLYAAMYLGVVVAPIDRLLKVGELEHFFNIYKPSMVICQSENTTGVQTALGTLNMDARILTFNKQDNYSCLDDILKADDEEVIKFKASDFNAEESIATCLPTSGSTGLPKGANITYKTWMITGPHFWIRFIKYPTPTRSWLILAPLQWLTAALHYITAPILKYTLLLTSKTITPEHMRFLVDTYKPSSTALSPIKAIHLFNSKEGECDMTCFDIVVIGGSAVDIKTLENIKAKSPKTTVMNAYGMTELSTIAFQGDSPFSSCGKPSGIYQHRLINIDTQEEIEEPYVNGELWIKGPMFKEYFNNPKETAEAFSEDGWLKTGDLFYRDEHWNFYFVERIKQLLKGKNGQMSPTEIERVIRSHPHVMDAAVTGIPHPEFGEMPAACVITKPGYSPTAQEIKDLVKDKLTDAKQLRGGVAFVASFPLTASAKINRKKLNEMMRNMKLE